MLLLSARRRIDEAKLNDWADAHSNRTTAAARSAQGSERERGRRKGGETSHAGQRHTAWHWALRSLGLDRLVCRRPRLASERSRIHSESSVHIHTPLRIPSAVMSAQPYADQLALNKKTIIYVGQSLLCSLRLLLAAQELGCA